MSHAYANLDGMIPYKTHRVKLHERGDMHEVEWQRDWQVLNTYEDHRDYNPWESTRFQFSTAENALAFAQMVLDGDLTADGQVCRKITDAQFVADGNARRTQYHAK